MAQARLLNPFRVESPEKLSPDQLVALFIERYTRLETIKQRKHTFLWGSRGSGKSMLLRYLEPRCQALVHRDFAAFLETPESFLAIYCPCKEGLINKTDLNVLNTSAALILTEHLLNLHLADLLLASLATQFPDGFFATDQCHNFVRRAIRLFDRASIAPAVSDADEQADQQTDPFAWFRTVCQGEKRRVTRFLRSYAFHPERTAYDGATSGYHDFLLPFLQAAQQLLPVLVPLYVLLDDADRLTKAQQGIVNTWIANRDHSIVCLKVSAQREHYHTFRTRDGGLIEQPHDYSEVDVDELYTRFKSDYHEKVRLIADKRLQLSNVSTKDISSFLPPDDTQQALLELFRKETAQEWDRVRQPGRQSDFVGRYAMARLFQYLKSKKQEKSYAGFDNIVHLSSGVVRDFLEPCYLMFDDVISRNPEQTDLTHINPVIQDRVLNKYSEDFLLAKFEDVRKDLPPESWSLLESLRVLLDSLGKLFYERLHDPEAREARLFSFTVRGQVSQHLTDLLRMGVRYRYFQLRTYSSKEGGGRENWYVLNRRLCPKYKLDPSGFEGRISLTPELLELAAKDSTKFVRLRLKLMQGQDDGQQALFALEAGEPE